jgi:pimeloyl-ACP methyl ester carboxylesterase
MEYRDITTLSSGKHLHSIACGNGDLPLHYLHANGLCAGTYLPLFEHCQNDFNIFATDIPGHGDSAPHGPNRILHWDIFVDPVKEALIRHMKQPVIGAGHSLGAVVTLLTAVKYPGLFSHIVLIDPVVFTNPMLFLLAMAKKSGIMKLNPLAQGARRRRTVFESREKTLKRFSTGRGMFRTWEQGFIQAFCDHGLSWHDNGPGVLKCCPETEAQIYESVLMDIWSYPKKVTCPTLIIRGEKSDTFMASAARTLVKQIKGSHLVTVPGATHFIPMEKPVEIKNSILDFVKIKA